MSHRFVANEVIVDIEKLSLVRNSDGVLNTDAFRYGLAGAKPNNKADPGLPKSVGTRTDFLIRHLVLKFDRMVMADYSGKKPIIKEYDLKLSRDMRDVDSVAKLVTPFLGVALDATGTLRDLAPSA